MKKSIISGSAVFWDPGFFGLLSFGRVRCSFEISHLGVLFVVLHGWIFLNASLRQRKTSAKNLKLVFQQFFEALAACDTKEELL